MWIRRTFRAVVLASRSPRIAAAPSPRRPRPAVDDGPARPETGRARWPQTLDLGRLHLAHRAASLQSPRTHPRAYREPVPVPWAAREGRLRLLRGWPPLRADLGPAAARGSTLVYVMSPSVSLDGRRILFAGRKGEHDRWPIYRVRVDGSGLRQLTGGPDDPGCIAVPPLRFRADGSRIPDRTGGSSTTTTLTPPTWARTASPSPRADCPTWAATTATGPPRSGPGPPPRPPEPLTASSDGDDSGRS